MQASQDFATVPICGYFG